MGMAWGALVPAHLEAGKLTSVCQLVTVASVYWLPVPYLDGLGVDDSNVLAFI